ncbi:MAG: hypothetical protein L6R35_002995 [Caloplaca aegaea]|nr:MAG: hypothetical protein L6R35_002995 [Caloplaca aegaea]
MKLSAAAIASASFASVVAGQGCSRLPVGEPAGNPISRPLVEIIVAGTPFTIEWRSTTTGTVNIELLRGPPTNVVPIDCLIENLSNTGRFVWTPSPSLEADVSRYGLRIVDTATGQYQYSTQFGISNDAVHPPSSSSTSSASASASASSPSSSSVARTTSPAASQATDSQVQVPTTSAEQTVTASLPVGSGSGVPQILTVLQPSKNMTVPASLQTSPASLQTSTTAGPTRVTASASASLVSSSLSGTGSPIAEATGPSAPGSGAGKAFAGSFLAGLGAMAAFVL